MSSNTIVILTLIAYKLILLGIGFWASRRVHTESDFFIAGGGKGGGLGAWTAGLSYAASTSSAWVLLGFTGMVFAKGLIALWLVPGIFAGYILTWLVIGPRLNADTAARGHMTIVDFIIGDVDPKWRRMIGIVAASMILFCFVFYISSQFQAAGNAFSSVFDMSGTKAVLLGAAIIVVYCLLGGFWAASVTDTLQAFVMMLACILVPAAALIANGGWAGLSSGLGQIPDANYLSLTGGAAGMMGAGLALGLLGTGLGALGQPQLLNRIMAVKSRKARLQGAAITIGWGAIVYTGLTLLALSVRPWAGLSAAPFDPSGEQLFFEAAARYLPPVMAGIVIAAVLSAVMSTVDSLLLAAASAVSHDMGVTYQSPQKALLFGRLAMVAVAIVAVVMTLYAPQTIFKRVLFSWVALGAAFGPMVLTKCLGWRVGGGAVLAAMLAGFFIAVIAYNGAKIEGLSPQTTTLLGVTEKWLSWIAGLLILFLGKERGANAKRD